MHRITIMGKPGCHLCDAAKKVVDLVVGQRIAVLIETVDITQDPALFEKYRDDIPVVLVDGVERFRHTVEPNALAKLFFDELGERLVALD